MIHNDGLLSAVNATSSVKKNEMGGACRIYGGEERCMQGFGEET
jgi:hypothetical protein